MGSDLDLYIDNESVIKDDKYESFKSMIMCYICKNILIEPKMCKDCQIACCNKCIKLWVASGKACPKCEKKNADFVGSKGRLALLSLVSFLCEKCSQTVKYGGVSEHINSGCGGGEDETSSGLVDNFVGVGKMKRLKGKQIDEMGDKEVEHINSKLYYNKLYL